MIPFTTAPKKLLDDLVAFVIMPRPVAAPAKRWLVVDSHSKGNNKSAKVNNILTKRNLVSDPTDLPNHSSSPHLIYRTLRPRKTVGEWHPEPPRPVGLVAGLRNSNSFSSVYSISPLLSIPTDLYLGESAVGKVSPSLQSILPALFWS